MFLASTSYSIDQLESLLRVYYEALSYAPSLDVSLAILAAIAWIVMVLLMWYKLRK